MAHGHIAESIRSARIASGLTQSAVARELGVDQSSISDWERGEATPKVTNVIRLAALFGIPVDQLLGEVAA